MVRFTVRSGTEDTMSWPNEMMKILTLQCEEASILASRELDEPLSLAECLAVRGHTLVCRSCRRFRHQLWLLRTAMNSEQRRVPGKRARSSPRYALARSAGADPAGAFAGCPRSR